jgi:hypothetical protein
MVSRGNSPEDSVRILIVMRFAGTLFFLVCLTDCKPPQSNKLGDASTVSIPVYNRDEWGRWLDLDKDCQDTRQEVLIAESEIPVTFIDPAKPCRVATGKWTDVYTGQVFTDPSAIQIDHTVALEEVHRMGGWAWTIDQKKAYFNDLSNPEHLVAVSISANASKGSRPPTEWLPPNLSFRCEYLRRRVKIMTKYNLQYDCSQYVDLMAKNCK